MKLVGIGRKQSTAASHSGTGGSRRERGAAVVCFLPISTGLAQNPLQLSQNLLTPIPGKLLGSAGGECKSALYVCALNLNCDQSPVAKFNFITALSVRYCLALSSASAFPKGHLPIRATRRHKEETSGNENLCFAHSQFAIRIHQCWPIKRTVKSTTRHFTWNTKQIERGNLSPFSFM